jgi:hypothetical protein
MQSIHQGRVCQRWGFPVAGTEFSGRCDAEIHRTAEGWTLSRRAPIELLPKVPTECDAD